MTGRDAWTEAQFRRAITKAGRVIEKSIRDLDRELAQ